MNKEEEIEKIKQGILAFRPIGLKRSFNLILFPNPVFKINNFRKYFSNKKLKKWNEFL